MAKKKTVDHALKLIRNLIESIRNPPTEKKENGKEQTLGSETFFTNKNLGGFRLTGKVDKSYRVCVDTILELREKSPTVHIQSQSSIRDMLNLAILRSVRPRKDPKSETPDVFRRRLNREISLIEKQLLSLPPEWKVSVPVLGIESTVLPFTFGSIRFIRGTQAAGRKLAKTIPDFDPGRRKINKTELQEEKSVREYTRNQIAKGFSSETIASISIEAFDAEAAENLGMEQIRRAVDILNFFAPFFHHPADRCRAFVAPDGKRMSLPSLCNRTDKTFAHWTDLNQFDAMIKTMNFTSVKARKYGLVRTGKILAQQDLTDLDRRILNALSWAGRAMVENRREEAFLLFAISLEALLGKPDSRVGVTDRLKSRTASLLGLTQENHNYIFELVGKLYARRSSIVHAGESTDLTEADLRQIRGVVQRSITCVLTDKRFSKIKTATEFEGWLDQRR